MWWYEKLEFESKWTYTSDGEFRCYACLSFDDVWLRVGYYELHSMDERKVQRLIGEWNSIIYAIDAYLFFISDILCI